MTTFKFKLTTQVALETLESNAQTFGELKADIQNSSLADKISFERKTEHRNGQEWVRTIKLIERNTQAEYGSIDNAKFPAGNTLIFFVTPIEHKGGLTKVEDLYLESFEVLSNELEELGYNEIRSFGSKLNSYYDADINLAGKRDDILERVIDWLEEYYNDLQEVDESEVDELEVDESEIPVKALLSQALDIIEQAISLLGQEEYVDNTTLSELHKKALELQAEINS